MGSAGWRWERALVVLALLAGVVAMHSLAMPMAHTVDHAGSVTTAATAPGHQPSGHPMAGGMTTTVATAMSAPQAPGLGGHTMLHVCLAVLTALLLLALQAAAHLRRTGITVDRAPARAPHATPWPRPPPPTSVRLAQLCVLRN
jgi:hypothetical protein